MPDFTRKPVFRHGTSAIKPSYWIGSRTSSGPADSDDVILTEDLIPILTEAGEFLLVES